MTYQISTAKENMLIFLLAAINFTHIMDFVVMAPLNPFMKEALSITTAQFGWLLSVYTIAAGVSGLIGFFFIDRYDRRTAILRLYEGFIIANMMCAIAPGYKYFMFARILAGLFGGVLGGLLLSIVGDVIPLERRGKATGIVMAAFSAASALGIPLGLTLAKQYDFHAPFWLLSGISILVYGFLRVQFPSLQQHISTTESVSPTRMLQQMLQQAAVQKGLVFIFFVMMSGMVVVPFISDYMVNNIGVDKSDLLYIYLFGGLATVVTGPLIGKLSDIFGKQRVYLWGAGLSLPVLYFITVLPPMPMVYIFICSTVFFIVFGARFVPAMTLLTSAVAPQLRGRFMSIASSVQQFASALSVVLAASIIENSSTGSLLYFDWVGMIGVGLTLVCMALSFLVKEVS
ncbi:MAG: MFS transporter [Cytophagaceae bacterium]|nr:MFS transporter [Cytophagaceae bacterium]